jgi:hypothetical protein
MCPLLPLATLCADTPWIDWRPFAPVDSLNLRLLPLLPMLLVERHALVEHFLFFLWSQFLERVDPILLLGSSDAEVKVNALVLPGVWIGARVVSVPTIALPEWAGSDNVCHCRHVGAVGRDLLLFLWRQDGQQRGA